MAIDPESAGNAIGRDAHLDAAYRAGAREKPGVHLDDAIRAAARRVAGAGPRRGSDRLRQWTLPVSLAAVVVLSFTVVLLTRQEEADRWNAERVLSPDRPRASAPGKPAVTDRGATPASPEQEHDKAEQPGIAVSTESVTQSRTPGQAAAQRTAPAPDNRRARESVSGKPTPQLEFRRRDGVAAEADSLPSAAESLRAPSSAVTAAPLRDVDPALAQDRRRVPSGPAAGEVTPAENMLWRDLEGQSAEEWSDRIRELRRAGRNADAEQLTGEFRRRFPDTRLPEDLH